MYLFERERANEGGVEEERERERDSLLSEEPDIGLNLTILGS